MGGVHYTRYRDICLLLFSWTSFLGFLSHLSPSYMFWSLEFNTWDLYPMILLYSLLTMALAQMYDIRIKISFENSLLSTGCSFDIDNSSTYANHIHILQITIHRAKKFTQFVYLWALDLDTRDLYFVACIYLPILIFWTLDYRD